MFFNCKFKCRSRLYLNYRQSSSFSSAGPQTAATIRGYILYMYILSLNLLFNFVLFRLFYYFLVFFRLFYNFCIYYKFFFLGGALFLLEVLYLKHTQLAF